MAMASPTRWHCPIRTATRGRTSGTWIPTTRRTDAQEARLESGSLDSDGDGIVNSADTDSDNDGIPDAIERGTGALPRDSDADGIADYLDRDSDNDRIPDAVEARPTPAAAPDTDGDGTPDYLDLDSDNDGLPDALEGGGTGVDTDNDEVDDFYDVNQAGGADANRRWRERQRVPAQHRCGCESGLPRCGCRR